MDAIRYGIFKLGQIWTLADEDGARLGFPSREVAIAALEAVIAVHRAGRASILVTLQASDGRLRTMLNPLDDLALEEAANGSAWDAFMEVRRPTPKHSARPS